MEDAPEFAKQVDLDTIKPKKLWILWRLANFYPLPHLFLRTFIFGVSMSDYAPIEQLRARPSFLNVEITSHVVDGEPVEGVDPKMSPMYFAGAVVVAGLGVLQTPLEHIGVSSWGVVGAQTVLVCGMVGQLARRVGINAQLENTYIAQYGESAEISEAHEHKQQSETLRKLKRVFLGATVVLTGSLLYVNAGDTDLPLLGRAAFLLGVATAGTAAAVCHLYDKMATTERGRLAQAIAQRRNESNGAEIAAPVRKTSV